MFCILKSAFALLFHKAQDTFIREKKKNVCLKNDDKQCPMTLNAPQRLTFAP